MDKETRFLSLCSTAHLNEGSSLNQQYVTHISKPQGQPHPGRLSSVFALNPASAAWPRIFLESQAPLGLLDCLSLFPRWALEDWRTFLGLPEASQLIQRDGPLPSSLWDSGKPITLGNSELLPLHLLLRHCLAAFPPQGGSLLFPAAPQSPSHLPRGPPSALPLRIRLLLILSWPCHPCLVRTAGPSITLAVHQEPF